MLLVGLLFAVCSPVLRLVVIRLFPRRLLGCPIVDPRRDAAGAIEAVRRGARGLPVTLALVRNSLERGETQRSFGLPAKPLTIE
jgi:hypothetical protein